MTMHRTGSESNGFGEAAALQPGQGWQEYEVVGDRGPDWYRLATVWSVVLLSFIEVLLAFRLGFLLAAANTENGFVSLILDVSGPLAAPFDAILPASKVGDSGMFEPSILVGMLVYLAAAGLLVSIVWALAATRDFASHTSARVARAGR